MLGVCLDRQGRAAASISHRIRAAMGLWVNTREYFCSRRIPLLTRFRKFYEVIGRCLLYGSGGWGIDCAAQLQRIQSFERTLLIQLLCRHKHDGETWAAFEVRRNALLTNLWNKTGIQPLMCEVALSYYGWAGHVARSPEYLDISRALAWRNISWFRTASLTPNRPRMSRVGRPVAWEMGLERSFGPWWSKMCSDRATWRIEKRRCAVEAWRGASSRPILHSMWPKAPVWKPLDHISNRLASFPGNPMLCTFLMVAVDSMQVACQSNGVWQLSEDTCISSLTKAAQWSLHGLKMCSGMVAWPGFYHMILHLPRKENSVADAAAFAARTGGSFAWTSAEARCRTDRILLMCDASFKCIGEDAPGSVSAGLGCAIFLYRGDQSWHCVHVAGLARDSRSSVTAEFEALNYGLYRLVEYLKSCQTRDAGGVRSAAASLSG
jgi:hypothetical protein